MDNGNMTDMEQLHAKLYDAVTNTITGIRQGTIKLDPQRCKECENLDKCEFPYVDALDKAFSEVAMSCGVSCQETEGRRIVQITYDGEIFMQVDPVTKEALQLCTDDMCNTVFYNQVFGV